MAQRLSPLIILVFLLGLSACSRFPQVVELSDVNYARRPPEYPIALESGNIENPYIEIALVRTKLYEEWSIAQAGGAELKRAARKSGGDAVINIRQATRLGESVEFSPNSHIRLTTKFKGKYYLEGTVIRFMRKK